MTSTVALDVGPVAPASAVAWMEWADETFGELRRRPPSIGPRSREALDGIERYFEQWTARTRIRDEAFRWHTDIDPDELEYLLCALVSLDARLSGEAQRGQWRPDCGEGRLFFLVLVRALLHALETTTPGRAAFADQLRAGWPSADEVG